MIEGIFYSLKAFAKSLEVHDLPLAQEFDRLIYVRVILAQSEDVVVGRPGFLLSGHILKKICYRVALALEFAGVKWNSSCRLGPDADGVVDIIFVKARCLDLLDAQIPCELVNDGRNHLEMGKFLGSDVGQSRLDLLVRHGISLRQVSH